MYREFQSFRFVVQDLVEGFHIASDAVLHSPHILQDVISGQIFGIYDAADVQAFNDIVKGDTVYF